MPVSQYARLRTVFMNQCLVTLLVQLGHAGARCLWGTVCSFDPDNLMPVWSMHFYTSISDYVIPKISLHSQSPCIHRTDWVAWSIRLVRDTCISLTTDTLGILGMCCFLLYSDNASKSSLYGTHGGSVHLTQLACHYKQASCIHVPSVFPIMHRSRNKVLLLPSLTIVV